MRFCIAGKNDIAVEVLDYLVTKKIPKKDVFVIPNRTDDGVDSWQRSLLKKAKDSNVEVISLEKSYSMSNMVFLSLEFDKIINPEKFLTTNIYNIHFSLLPKYKGMFTSIMPILNNELFTGVTFHKIDKGIDTGDIIEQVEFKINFMDNSREVYHNYINHGTSLVKKCIDKIFKNDFLKSTPQNFIESSYYSKKAIDFSRISIDLNQVAVSVHNQVRAFNFREYQVPKVFNTPVISSKILNSQSKLKAGEVILENDISFTVSTVDKDIILYKDKVDELFIAIEKGSVQDVDRLARVPKVLNVQNKYGWTPLIVAIYNNNKDIVKTLLMSGADLNICNFKGTTPLMYAKSAFVKTNDPEIIKLLLDFGVDIYQTDYDKKNVLDYCIENNEVEALNCIKNSLKNR